MTTGVLVKYAGWRAAFVVPALVAFACGIAFARVAPDEHAPPAAAPATQAALHTRGALARIFAVMTVASITSSLLFNFTTNGNGQLLRERFAAITARPGAARRAARACVYVVASFAQVAVGLLIDRVSAQAPLRRHRRCCRRRCSRSPRPRRAGRSTRCMIAFMVAVFGAIPFTDAMIVRYVDDRMRSRVSGMRLAVSFGVSSARRVGCWGRSSRPPASTRCCSRWP